MCVALTYRPVTLGDVRWLKLAGHYRSRGKSLTEGALKAEWEAVVTVREQAARGLIARLRRMFSEQERAVLESLSVPVKDFGIDAALSEVAWGDWMDEELRPIFRQILRVGYRTGAMRLDITLPAFNDTPRSGAVLQAAIDNLRETTETTKDRLENLISEMLSEGSTRDEIRSAIRAQFADWRETRADQAGITAATGAFEGGQLEAFEDGGVERRRWLSQRDGNVRPEHDFADGQEVGISESFDVGGEPLQYPGDPSGSIGNVINCRCATLPLVSAPATRSLSWIDRRDDQIRNAFDHLKRLSPTAEAARLDIGDVYGLSDAQIQRIVYSKRRS